MFLDSEMQKNISILMKGEDAEERQFIYDVSKKMYETDYMGSVHAYDCDLRELGISNDKVVDKTELLQILKRQKSMKGILEEDEIRYIRYSWMQKRVSAAVR